MGITPLDFWDVKQFSLALGIAHDSLTSPLSSLCALDCLQPPMLWSIRLVPVAHRGMRMGGGGCWTLFFGSSQEKESRGFVIFAVR